MQFIQHLSYFLFIYDFANKFLEGSCYNIQICILVTRKKSHFLKVVYLTLIKPFCLLARLISARRQNFPPTRRVLWTGRVLSKWFLFSEEKEWKKGKQIENSINMWYISWNILMFFMKKIVLDHFCIYRLLVGGSRHNI